MRVKLFIVGGALLLASLAAGFFPLSVTSLHVSCGTAFFGLGSGDPIVQTATHVTSDCRSKRWEIGVLASILFGMGLCSVLGGTMFGGSRRPSGSVS